MLFLSQYLADKENLQFNTAREPIVEIVRIWDS